MRQVRHGLILASVWLLVASVLAACRPVMPNTEPTLTYAGPAERGSEDTSRCATLEIDGDRATVTGCNGTAQTVALGERDAREWAEIQARLAPFRYDAADAILEFTGTGTIEGAAWQRALVNWARARYDELGSGKPGAAAHTVVAWNLGPTTEDEKTCKHLTVLSWGYAYAESVACADRATIDLRGGWLETAELESLDRWLHERAPLYADDNYVAGQATQPMSEAETGAVAAWADALWTRLQTANRGAAVCTNPASGEQLLVVEEHGYCLVYPAGYIAEQTTANAVNLVLGSLMNHVDPRVSITVEDAAGRTLAEAADQLEADYAMPGMPVERSTGRVDGAEAIVLDNLPGQDWNRRVVFLHKGRLYSLFFTPLGDTEEAQAAMEAFYGGVMDSFRFLDAEH